MSEKIGSQERRDLASSVKRRGVEAKIEEMNATAVHVRIGPQTIASAAELECLNAAKRIVRKKSVSPWDGGAVGGHPQANREILQVFRLIADFLQGHDIRSPLRDDAQNPLRIDPAVCAAASADIVCHDADDRHALPFNPWPGRRGSGINPLSPYCSILRTARMITGSFGKF